MQTLYDELNKLTENIAVRITADCYEQYISLLKNLKEYDYILFDIEETDVRGLKYDTKDFMDQRYVKISKLLLYNHICLYPVLL